MIDRQFIWQLFFKVVLDGCDQLFEFFGGEELGFLFSDDCDFEVLSWVVDDFAKCSCQESRSLDRVCSVLVVLLEVVHDVLVVLSEVRPSNLPNGVSLP